MQCMWHDICSTMSKYPYVVVKSCLKSLTYGSYSLIYNTSTQNMLDQGLFTAIKHNNLYEAVECIQEGADVNAQASGGATPLHNAALEGNLEICKLLIAHGANIDTKDNNDWTSLHNAAFKDHREVCELLIAHGANIDTKNNYCLKPLHLTSIADIRNLLINIEDWQELTTHSKMLALVDPEYQFELSIKVKKIIFDRFYYTFDFDNLKKLNYKQQNLVNMVRNSLIFKQFISSWND